MFSFQNPLAMSFGLLVSFAVIAPLVGAVTNDDDGVDVFVSGKENYPTFRIPSILSLANGDLLVFAEGRHGCVVSHTHYSHHMGKVMFNRFVVDGIYAAHPHV